MKSSKLMVSIVLITLFSVNTIFAAASDTTGSSLVVVQNDQKIFVPREETKVTKEYITALALDGLFRVYKAGLDFTDATGKFRDLGKIDETIMCAFGKNSLLYVTADEWDSYKTCITSKGLIDGNNKTGMVFDKSDLKRFTEDNSKVNPPFFVSYRGFPLGGRNREFDGGGYIYPGPLALIYWGIKNIGVNLLNDGSSLSSNNCEKLYTITRQAIPGDGFYYNHPSFTFIANEYKEVDQQNCAQSLPKYVSCEVSRVEFKGTSCEKLSIGKACLQFINSPTERFQQLALEVIELINSRKSTGDLQYVDKMSVKLNEMQSVLDQHSKKKVLTDSSKQSNLINLHLTTEGATKLGQKVHEHMRDAYVASTSSITDDQAVNLATQFVEILKAKGFDKLMTQEEMGMDLDAILAVFDEMKKFHAGEINPTQQKLGVTGTNALVMQSLNDYRLLDNNVENKAQDTLRQAFHIGRVLQANEGTKEFDVATKGEERQKEKQVLVNDINKIPAATVVHKDEGTKEFDVATKEEERQKEKQVLDIKGGSVITAGSNSDDVGEEKKEL